MGASPFPTWWTRIVPIATPGRSSPQSIAYNEVGRQAIMLDPNWRGGDYYDGHGPEQGLAIARMVGMITYQSDASMWHKFGRELMKPTLDQHIRPLQPSFRWKATSTTRGKSWSIASTPTRYIYLTRALDLFDLGRGRGGFKKALSRIRVPTLVIGISSDILYPPYQQKEIVTTLQESGVDAEYAEIDCPYGHDGFLIEAAKVTGILREFFERLEG